MDEDNRHIKDKDSLAWNKVLQELARLCLKFIHSIPLLPKFRDSLRSAMYYDVSGLPFKTKIDKYELIAHIPFYYEKKLLMNDRDIWGNPVKRDGLLNELKYKYAVEEVYFLIQVMAEHGALQEAKGFVETGIEKNLNL